MFTSSLSESHWIILSIIFVFILLWLCINLHNDITCFSEWRLIILSGCGMHECWLCYWLIFRNIAVELCQLVHHWTCVRFLHLRSFAWSQFVVKLIFWQAKVMALLSFNWILRLLKITTFIHLIQVLRHSRIYRIFEGWTWLNTWRIFSEIGFVWS